MVQPKNIAERYDPVNNTWETLSPMSEARHGVASAVLNGKLYAIGGHGLSSVEIYDPSTESWSTGPSLPSEVNHGTAITVNGKIYLDWWSNSSDQNINQVLCFDPSQINGQLKQTCQQQVMELNLFGLKIVFGQLEDNAGKS